MLHKLWESPIDYQTKEVWMEVSAHEMGDWRFGAGAAEIVEVRRDRDGRR